MNWETGFEIDFLPVGTGEKNGDAIALRFGVQGNYKVMVYDGGTKDSGAALVAHIRQHYQTNRVDYMVNTHPDRDHASGLSVVLDEMDVGELWMHQPWDYSSEICGYFRDGRITDKSLGARLQEKMSAAYQLEQLAKAKGVKIFEPFEGALIGGIFRVLSPSKNWYIHTLIPEFAKSPELKAAIESSDLGNLLKALLEKAANWVDETLHIETLKENVSTSAENESSVILYGKIDSEVILLTGDAGIRALAAAATYAASIGIDIPNTVSIVQVPHHGSRHNISPTVMNMLFGMPHTKISASKPIAVASVAAKCATHPRPAVSNAFIRRGFEVTKTTGTALRYRHKMPLNPAFSYPVDFIPFSTKVEA
jgi:beta-lactamase superfamily II metal-dependent hydrolase